MKAPKNLRGDKWYLPYQLTSEGLREVEVRRIEKDGQQIRLKTKDGEVAYAGASVLNYLVRDERPEVLSDEQRYMSPVSFARILERPAVSLVNDESRTKSIVGVDKPNGFMDFVVDVTRLHRFDFGTIDHSALTELENDTLVKRYRLSGKNNDYLEALLTKSKSKRERIAQKILNKIPNGAIQLDELVQMGYFGLLDALDKYDLKSAQFKTYLAYRFRGAILDGLREIDLLPRSMKIKLKRIWQAKEEFLQENERIPDEGELRGLVGMTPEKFDEVAPFIDRPDTISLDDAYGNRDEDSDGFTRGDINLSVNGHEQELPDNSRIAALELGLATLDETDQQIVYLYYWEGIKMKEIAKRFNLSESRVCQRMGKITAHLGRIREIRDLTLNVNSG